jgi:hypothetical protein
MRLMNVSLGRTVSGPTHFGQSNAAGTQISKFFQAWQVQEFMRRSGKTSASWLGSAARIRICGNDRCNYLMVPVYPTSTGIQLTLDFQGQVPLRLDLGRISFIQKPEKGKGSGIALSVTPAEAM